MAKRFDVVVVVGGGYAGVTATSRLRSRSDVNVTLIDPRSEFVERIRLHRLVAGSDDAVMPYADVLAAGVTQLVDAVGSTDATPAVPGAVDYAHRVAYSEHTEALRAKVAVARRGTPLVVRKGNVFCFAREARRPGSYPWLEGGNRARRVAEAHPTSQ